jgi:hypothetical protein
MDAEDAVSLAKRSGQAMGRVGSGAAGAGIAAYKGVSAAEETGLWEYGVARGATSAAGSIAGGLAGVGAGALIVGAPPVAVAAVGIGVGIGVGLAVEAAGNAMGDAIADGRIARYERNYNKEHCRYLQSELKKAEDELFPLSRRNRDRGCKPCAD